MTPTAKRAVRRHPGVLLCLGIIAAVFAMHGPSINHMLAMPAPTSTSSATAHQQPAHTMHAAGAVRFVDRPATVSSGVAECGMGHADCLATLRHAAAQSPPPSCADAMHVAAALADAPAAKMPVPRAPPRPLRERLCISRT